MTRYAVIDFETNGQMPGQGGRALEVAAVLVENGAVIDQFASLMNPGGRVPAFITALTGITPSMVRMAPPPDEVMQAVSEFVGAATPVAHNASFDRRFWEYELNLCGAPCQLDFLCTVLIGRRLYPWAPNHKLATLVELHRIPVEGRHHRALADAAMTAHLFIKMQRDLALLYPQEWQAEDFLARYQRTGKALVRSTSPKNLF